MTTALFMNTIPYEQDPLLEHIRRQFLTFLNDFTAEDTTTRQSVNIYKQQAENMRNNERTTLYVAFEHIASFYSEGTDFLEQLIMEYYRIEPFLRRAVHNFIFNLYPDFAQNKMFSISLHNIPSIEKIRDLNCNRIGRLMSFTGTVTRTTEVRPELVYGSFTCVVCNNDVRDIEQQFRYTEPKACRNPNCDNKTKWELNVEASIFCDWQKLKIQENSNEIPPGGMPRSTDVILRDELVDSAKPGDRCIFTGTLVVVPDIVSLMKPGEKIQVNARSNPVRRNNQLSLDGVTGLKALGVRDLNYRMVFMASHVQTVHNRFGLNSIRDEENEDEILKSLTQAEKEEILDIKDQPDLYNRLAKSIAPTVFGHEEIKKGILLMLFGGVSKKTPEGMKLRGDINTCIIGDPSTAKSQFLKYVCSFLPRSVYTSGKATSSAGLTATVSRDPDSGEFCIEAGALMLADNGICCIDEFDKMESRDQVAIHEAMEQQTISIAKAGIQATLNARTSILAAANPIFGRYDKSKSLKFNLDISAPIMSRFDLFFVVLDECVEYIDYSLAQHIVNLHRNKERAIEMEFTTQQLQRYIRFARTVKPQFTTQAADALREEYIKLRLNDVTFQKAAYRITVRQLESLVRLSEALSRVHCSNEITVENVREASRLLSNSILRVVKPDLEIDHLEGIQNDLNRMELESEADNKEPNIIRQEIEEQRPEELKKQTIKLTYDEYDKISKAIALFLREKEGEFEQMEGGGISQNDIVNWYVEQNINLIESQEQANQLAKIVHSVINRMINQDKALIIVKDDIQYKERLLQLHPNFTE